MVLHEDKLISDFSNSIRHHWLAHKPIEDSTDVNFGSIKFFAEVWSLCFSPSTNEVATASEDQTIAIWKIEVFYFSS